MRTYSSLKFLGGLLLGCQLAHAAPTIEFPPESERIVITGSGSVTLSDIEPIVPSGVLTELSSGVWFLEAHIMVMDGATLDLKGSSAGGDVNQLYLRSDYEGFVSIRADEGSTINIDSTTISSRDKFTNLPDVVVADGRAWIEAKSRLNPADFSTPMNSTLNVNNANIENLGTDFPNQRALNWIELCDVPTLGTVSNSTISESYFYAPEWGKSSLMFSGNTWDGGVITDYDSGSSQQAAVHSSSTFTGTPSFATPVADIRWSNGSSRIYIENHGRTTLTEIRDFISGLNLFSGLPTDQHPLEELSNKRWVLRADIYIEDGCQLLLHGDLSSPDPNPTNASVAPSVPTPVGGDCNELRMKSDSTRAVFITVGEAVPKPVISDWGYLDIRNTKVTSWDEDANGPDTQHYDDFPTTKRENLPVSEHRAFIKCRGGLNWDFRTSKEGRLDIHDSEIAYLGLQSAEAYGLTWKVAEPKDDREYVSQSGSTLTTTSFVADHTLYDKVDVWGDIKRSRIHHLRFAIYTFGSKDNIWEYNETDNNSYYGFDPHDDSDDVIMRYNLSHSNVSHGMICSQRCNNLYFGYNISRNNGDATHDANGIMIHRDSNFAIVEHNESHDNTDSGIAIFASDNTIIRNNTIDDCGNAGIRFSVGSSYNEVYDNEITDCGKYGFFFFKGSDDPRDGDDGLLKGNIIGPDNTVRRIGDEGVKCQDGFENVIFENTFTDTSQNNTETVFRFEAGKNNLFKNNVIPSDSIFKFSQSSTVSTSATSLIVSEQDPLLFKFEGQSDITWHAATEGTSATPRHFFASPSTGELIASPIKWEATTGGQHEWITRSSISNQVITFEIGDLTPGNTYNLFRDGTLAGTGLVANGTGAITSSVVPNKTTEAVWTLQDPNYIPPPVGSAVTDEGSFIATGGQASMEAANFHASSAGTSDREWIPATNAPSNSSGNPVFTLSGTPSDYKDAGSVLTDSPSLTWDVEIGATGVYDIWVRGATTVAGNNSVWIALESPTGSIIGPVLYGNFDTSWEWIDSSSVFGVNTVGTHKIHLYMREETAAVDKIIISQSSLEYDPGTGTGLAQSDQLPLGGVNEIVIPVPCLTINGSQLSISFDTLNDTQVRYQVLKSSDLASWTPVGSEIGGTGGEVTVPDTVSGIRHFYRVEVDFPF